MCKGYLALYFDRIQMKQAAQDIYRQMMRGDENALKQLMALYYQELCQYSSQLTQDSVFSEDSVSKAFFDVWQKAQRREAVENIRAYLFVIVRNSAIEHLKKHTFVMDTISEKYQLIEDDDNYRQRLSNKLEQAINQFPFQQKEAFILRNYQGLSYTEIARIMDISVSMVKKHLSRGLNKLLEQREYFLKDDED